MLCPPCSKFCIQHSVKLALTHLQDIVRQNPKIVQSGSYDVESGVAPLHLAADQGQLEVLSALISAGADLQALDGHGQTALQVAWAHQ